MADSNDPSFTPLLLALPSLTPSLALEVLPRGLTIHRLYVQADGRTHDIVIGPENPVDHVTQKYTNTVIGRYANRIPVGSHTLSRNGFTATLNPQPNEAPETSLHGGKIGWDSVPWEPLLDPSASQLFTQAELSSLQLSVPTSCIFSRVSEDGEEGFPGRLAVEVLFGLLQPSTKPTAKGEWHLGSLVIIYRAKLLDENTVTPINMTQHWGFNLDVSLKEGTETETVKDHKLLIKAPHTVTINKSLHSTGVLAPVSGTHHAHAEKTTGKIGENFPNPGYDEFYVFDAEPSPPPTRIPSSSFDASADFLKDIVEPPASEEGVVELQGARSGLRVTFKTNQSGVQFYSNNFSSPTGTARKKIHGGSGTKGDGYGPGSAAFLEFHEPLAAFLHPDTVGPSKNDTLLASGEVYNNWVRMDVWYRGEGAL